MQGSNYNFKKVFLSLGANQENKSATIDSAVKFIGKISHVSILSVSSKYLTEPLHSPLRGKLKGALTPSPSKGESKNTIFPSPLRGDGKGEGDDWFINIVISIETSLSPESLLRKLMEIEVTLGRPHNREKGEPRTIDIDILLYGSDIISTDTLTIPHPEMCSRKFVLIPLAEISPDTVHPVSGLKIIELLERCEDIKEVLKLQ